MLIKHQSFEVTQAGRSRQRPTLYEPKSCRYLKFLLIPGVIGFMLLCILINVNFNEDSQDLLQNITYIKVSGNYGEAGTEEANTVLPLKEEKFTTAMNNLPEDTANGNYVVVPEQNTQLPTTPTEIVFKPLVLPKTEKKANADVYAARVLSPENIKTEESAGEEGFENLTTDSDDTTENGLQIHEDIKESFGNSVETIEVKQDKSSRKIINQSYQKATIGNFEILVKNLQNEKMIYSTDAYKATAQTMTKPSLSKNSNLNNLEDLKENSPSEENFLIDNRKPLFGRQHKFGIEINFRIDENATNNDENQKDVKVGNYTTLKLNKQSGNVSFTGIENIKKNNTENKRFDNNSQTNSNSDLKYVENFYKIFDFKTYKFASALPQENKTTRTQANVISPTIVHNLSKRQVGPTKTALVGSASCSQDKINCVLTCSDGSLSYIDQDLDDMQFICPSRDLTLSLENCIFPNGIMKSSFFVGDYRLKALAIINCNLDTIQAGAFKQNTVKNLQSLELINNAINALGSNTFEGLAKLTNFRFLQEPLKDTNFKGTEFLKPLATTLLNATIRQKSSMSTPVNPRNWLQGTDLKSLYTLDLNNNNLQGVLEADTFRTLVAVRRLYLENCSLDHIDMSPFAAIKNLYMLYLNNNRLKTLDTMFLDGIHNRGILLSAQGNEWQCDCEHLEMIEYLQGIVSTSSLNREDYVCYEPLEWKDLNMFTITLECKTTMEDITTTTMITTTTTSTVTHIPTTTMLTTSVVTEDDKSTKDTNTTPTVTDDNTTIKDTTTAPVSTNTTQDIKDTTTTPTFSNTTQDSTTSPEPTEDGNTTKETSSTPQVSEDDRTTEDIITTMVTEGDITSSSSLTEEWETYPDATTTETEEPEDTSTSTSPITTTTNKDDGHIPHLPDMQHILCYSPHSSESLIFPLRSSQVHLNISSISDHSVRIRTSYKHNDSFVLIYFNNQHQYTNATQISQNEWIANDMIRHESYLFCVVSSMDPKISPFDCHSYSLSSSAESWLQIEDMPWFIAAVALVAIHCGLIGSSVVYYILRRKSRVYLNSQPACAISDKSPTASRSSRVSLRQHNRVTYLSPQPHRKHASKCSNLVFASPPMEIAPTVPNLYHDQPSREEVTSSPKECPRNKSKSPNAIYIDAIVHYEETASNLSNIYNEITEKEICDEDNDYHVIDHYEEIQF